jgi:hypothetical protein
MANISEHPDWIVESEYADGTGRTYYRVLVKQNINGSRIDYMMLYIPFENRVSFVSMNHDSDGGMSLNCDSWETAELIRKLACINEQTERTTPYNEISGEAEGRSSNLIASQ